MDPENEREPADFSWQMPEVKDQNAGDFAVAEYERNPTMENAKRMVALQSSPDVAVALSAIFGHLRVIEWQPSKEFKRKVLWIALSAAESAAAKGKTAQADSLFEIAAKLGAILEADAGGHRGPA